MRPLAVLLALGFFLGCGPAGAEIRLTRQGVACDLGDSRSLTLGIPALDGRGVHAPAMTDGIVVSDGRLLTATFGPPFQGVALSMRLLGDGRVEYRYENLPEDAKLVMCQFNLPSAMIPPGLTVVLDDARTKEIPVKPGSAREAVRLLDANAARMILRWPSGESLSLQSERPCWHGVQDSRVWGKDFVGVCLTPSLRRDRPGGTTSTFTLAFGTAPSPSDHR